MVDEATKTIEQVSRFGSYVPRVASSWDDEASGSLWRPVEGSLVFVDISGFTNLSERLARKGRIGAEELTAVLNRVFGRMLNVVFERGGSLLKFGGDALLLLFETEDHVLQATAATVEMRAVLREASKEPTSVGRINLKMSSGIHTGSVDFFLVGESHRELIVTGPTASITTEMEGTADAGEIVVSSAIRDQLPSGFTGDAKGDGWLLRKQKVNIPMCGLIIRPPVSEETLASMVPLGLRDHLASGMTDAEHRIATVGFIKFKGIDALLANEGPERVGKELDLLVRTVQQHADHEAITFLASDIDADGGKIILTAGVPSSQHDDEGRVLRAARQILDTELGLPVRIGVNRGHVFSGNVGTEFRRTYTVMGDTVNLAARLMAAADPGMLYAAPSALNLSSTLFRTEALEPFYVKGKEQPVQAYAVFDETGVRPPSHENELPFKGRDAELQMMVGIVNTCSRVGRGGMMTITGDTGVGKSRLIAEVMDRCSSGMDTLMVQAEPNGMDNSYWAFRDPMRRQLGIQRSAQTDMAKKLRSAVKKMAPKLEWAIPLLGDVMHIDIDDNAETAAIDPQFRPERTAEVVVELLSLGHTRPFAIVAEDGQWLDEASMALLNRIGEAAKSRPWTILITARGEDEGFEPLGDEIKLRPLKDDAVRSIVIEVTAATPLRPHDLDNVVAKADGNPLFLSEILRVIKETGSADELPESLGALVSKEIDTLPPLTRHILRYASVLGRSFHRDVLEELLAPDDVHLDDATEKELAQLVEPDVEGRLRFRHAVVHEAAYEGLSYRKRRELHARAGDVIKRNAGDDLEAVAEYLANHYSEAGVWSGALEFSMTAGAKADALYANMQAAAFYERALTAAKHLESTAPSEIAALQEARGDALERAGRFEDSLSEYAGALRLTPSVTRKADLMFKRARLKAWSGNYSAGLAELTRAIRRIEGDSSKSAQAARARLRSFRSVIRIMQGRSYEALRIAEAARTEADEASEREALARSYMVLDAAYLTLGRTAPEDYLSKALEIYEDIGDLLGAALVYNNMGERAWLEGRLDEAIEFIDKANETNIRAGNDPEAARARTNIGEILIAQGKLDEARAMLEESSRVLRAHGSEVAAYAEIQLARVALEEGEAEGAVRALTQSLEEVAALGQMEWLLVARIYLASAHRAQRDIQRTLELLDQAEAEIDQGGDLYGPLLAMVRAETLRDLGDISGALEHATKGRDAAKELGLQREQSQLEELVNELKGSAALV